VCLIIDANVVHRIFPSPSEDHRPIRDALANRAATLVYGGELKREYSRINWFRPFLRRLDQTGAAKIVPDSEVDAKSEALQVAGGYLSDDPHILALALITKVRLLCSEDNNLTMDFTNRDIINTPRGNVYRRAKHAHLIRKHCR